MKPIFMTYTKKDLINLAVCMVLSVLIIPTFIKTEYWYTSILIPWLCLALATIGQQIVMGYTGQLALGAAGFMAAGAFAMFNLILRVPELGFIGSLAVSGLIAAAFGILFGLPSLKVALFKRMSVLDNILVGRKLHTKTNFLEVALQLPKVKKEEKLNRDRSEEIISFLEIEDIKDTPVGKLPYGLQKKVELGRALATDSTIILLDEPMAGMNVEEKRDMCRFILKVNDELGTTMVLIEHDMGVVMDISDRVVVLDYGKVIGDGTPDEVRSNQKVIDAYLGVEH